MRCIKMGFSCGPKVLGEKSRVEKTAVSGGNEGMMVLDLERPLAIIPKDQRITDMDYSLLQEALEDISSGSSSLHPLIFQFPTRYCHLRMPPDFAKLVISSPALRSAVLTEKAAMRVLFTSPGSRAPNLDPRQYLGGCYKTIRQALNGVPGLDTAFAIGYLISVAILLEHPIDVLHVHFSGLGALLTSLCPAGVKQARILSSSLQALRHYILLVHQFEVNDKLEVLERAFKDSQFFPPV